MPKTCLYSTLSSIDIFGYTPTLEINKTKNYKTKFSSAVSILIILTTIVAVWLFGKELFYKEKPYVILSKYHDADPHRTEFNDNNYIMALGLQNPDYSLYANDSIYTMQVKHHVVTRSVDNIFTDEVRVLEVVKCSEKKITLLENYFHKMDLNNLLCLKNGSFHLEGEFGRKIWAYIEFSFKRCQNSTLNNFSCKGKEEIERRLSGGYFGLFITDIAIQPSNYSEPSLYFGENLFTTFSILAYREIWMYMKRVQILSDIGWLMDENIQQDFFSYDWAKEVWDFRDTSDVFFNFILGMGLTRDVYQRTYVKIQQVAANVGGIFSFLMLCGKIITYYYNKLNFKSFLVNIFFQINYEELYGKKFTKNISHNFTEKNYFNNKENSNLNLYHSTKQENELKNKEISKVEDFNFTEKFNKNNNIVNLPKLKRKNLAININLSNNVNVKSINLNAHSLFSKYLSGLEILRFIVCCNNRVKGKIKLIRKYYEKLMINFDWLNLIKSQKELELIKTLIFSKEQKDIINLGFLNFEDNEEEKVKYFTF
jgi:hypothetical protein